MSESAIRILWLFLRGSLVLLNEQLSNRKERKVLLNFVYSISVSSILPLQMSSTHIYTQYIESNVLKYLPTSRRGSRVINVVRYESSVRDFNAWFKS